MITKKKLKAENEVLKDTIAKYKSMLLEAADEIALLSNSNGTIEVFQDTANEWRWHYKSPNGKIVFPSGQAFTKSNCMRAAKRVQEILGGEEITPIVVIVDNNG